MWSHERDVVHLNVDIVWWIVYNHGHLEEQEQYAEKMKNNGIRKKLMFGFETLLKYGD